MMKAVVTGGTKRIGLAIASGLADAGHQVFAHSRSPESASIDHPRIECHSDLAFDLADPAHAAQSFAAFLREEPETGLLVLSASMFSPDYATQIDVDNLELSIRANLVSQMRLAEVFVAHHRERRQANIEPPVIIALLDQKLLNPNPDFFSYTLTKYAMKGMVEMFGALNNDENIFAYGLAPGLTLPSHDQTQEEFEISSRMNLLQRQNQPEELATACIFLSKRILRNGTILLSDSGQHLVRQTRDVMYTVREQA